MSVWKWEYFSPEGRHWPLTDWEHQGVYIEEGGFPELAVQSGQRTMSGAINVVVDGSAVGRSNGEVMAEFRHDFDDEIYGTLVASSDDLLGTLSARIRLGSEGVITLPPTQPDEHGFVQFTVPVESDQARWVTEERYMGPTCLVENFGVDTVWPKVMWTSGGALTMPSGAQLRLPAVRAPRVVDFHPDRSGLVTDLDGVVDRELWVQLRGFYFEGVPRRAVRQFGIPAGASLIAAVPQREPWR